MTESPLSSMYSEQGLRALKESLQLHRGLVWADPTTNAIAVKSITEPQESESPDPVQQVHT